MASVLIPSIAPAFVLLLGYILYRLLCNGKVESENVLEQFLSSVVLGLSALVVPSIVILPILSLPLNSFFEYLTIFYLIVIVVLIIRLNLYSIIQHLKSMRKTFQKTSSFEKIIITIGLIYITKLVITYLYAPLDVDTLDYYAAVPSNMYHQNSIGFYLGEDPALIMLYAWSFSIFGWVSAEPFRMLNIIFAFCFPISIFLISKILVGRREALVASLVALLSVTTDAVITIYTFHNDMASMSCGMVSIYFALKPKRSMKEDLLLALSLGLSFLFKPFTGIMVTFALLLIMFSSIHNYGLRVFSVIISVFGFIFFSELFYSSILSSIKPMNVSLLLLVLCIGLVIMLVHRIGVLNIAKPGPMIGLLCLSPLVVWYAHAFIMGETPLGQSIPLRMPTYDAVNEWVGLLNSAVASTSAVSIQVLAMPLFHPMFNIILVPFEVVGIVLLILEGSILSLLIPASWLLYYAMMPPYSSPRQALFAASLLCIPFAKGLSFMVNRSRNATIKNHLYEISGLVIALISITQSSSFQLGMQYVAGPIQSIIAIFSSQTPWQTYTGFSEIGAFLPTLALSVGIMYMIVLISRLSSLNMRSRLHIRAPAKSKIKAALFLLLVISSSYLIIYPYVSYAEGASGGDLSNFKIQGSWWNDKYLVASDIGEMTKGVPGTISCWGFDGKFWLSQSGLSYIDLYESITRASPSLPYTRYDALFKMVMNTNLTEIESSLSEFGIRYFLLPNRQNIWFYPSFINFVNSTNMFRILNHSDALRMIRQYYYWDFYVLDTGSNTGIWDRCESINASERIWITYPTEVSLNIDSSVPSPLGTGSLRFDTPAGRYWGIYVSVRFNPSGSLLKDFTTVRPSSVFVQGSSTTSWRVEVVTRDPSGQAWNIYVVANQTVQVNTMTQINLNYSGISNAALQMVAQVNVIAQVNQQSFTGYIAGITEQIIS